MPKLIAPSILSANFQRLGDEIAWLDRSEADWIHIDVMDGVFVPNISFGFPVLEAIRPLSKKLLDTHLMIARPEAYIERFSQAGADQITVHLEACIHLHRTIQLIHACEKRAGVAINPHTPVSALVDILADLEVVLIMSVNPGFGGQKFILHTLRKIEEMRRMIEETGSRALIEVDGGIDVENSAAIFSAGADCLVAGHAVFASLLPAATIQKLKGL